ncbi:DUF5641 domain-containing protein [Trichonephila clavipes]|nr:DUF5641 domain-containing protein [Trichonephila clavipes]
MERRPPSVVTQHSGPVSTGETYALKIRGEKAANIIIYLKDEDLKNYDKIKSIILQEFEPTPQSCLENFKKATRQNCESHVQFASRLTTNWEYYLKLRDVSNFENTANGYIASGSIPVSSENKPHYGLIKYNVDLEKTMRRFWEIENVEPETIKNKETIICQSKDIALKKLNSLWNRLKREPNYLKLYRDFLKEYKQLGHMQEVDEKEECGMYFIPHLGVYRSDKKTSKFRVVLMRRVQLQMVIL